MSLRAAIESIEDTITPQIQEPEIRYVIEGITMSVDNASQALARMDTIVKTECFSIEQYHELKSWMYESTAMVGIDFKLPITLEHEGNVRRLALESIGEFFSKLWESIKAGFRWIFDLLKRLFGMGSDAKLKGYEHRIKLLKQKAKELEDKQSLLDVDKAKTIFSESVKDNKSIDTLFKVIQQNPPSGIIDFVKGFNNKLDRLATLSDFTIGDSSFARSFAQFIWQNKESWHLSTLNSFDGYDKFISALKSNTASINSYIPEDVTREVALKALSTLKSNSTSPIPDAVLSTAKTITLTNFESYKTHILVFTTMDSSDEKIEYKKEIKQNLTVLNNAQVDLIGIRSKYDVTLIDHRDLVSVQMLLTEYVDKIRGSNKKLEISLNKSNEFSNDLNRIKDGLNIMLNNGGYNENIVDSLKTMCVMANIFIKNMSSFQSMYMAEDSLLRTLISYIDLCTKAYEQSINID